MTAEEFIKIHPFPKNGAAINQQLVSDIQDPTKAEFKQQNLNKLLENNARLIYLVFKQYNYNQSLDSIMSFVYEGLCKATETYDSKVGMPFYHYAIRTIRGILQNWYKYNGSLIHIPVMKRKDVTYEYADITDFNEFKENESFDAFAIDDSEDESIDSLDSIITAYEEKYTMSDQSKHEFEILKMYRKNNIREISEKTGIKIGTVKIMLAKAIERLKKYTTYGT